LITWQSKKQSVVALVRLNSLPWRKQFRRHCI
jgi:hypothetical protein